GGRVEASPVGRGTVSFALASPVTPRRGAKPISPYRSFFDGLERPPGSILSGRSHPRFRTCITSGGRGSCPPTVASPAGSHALRLATPLPPRASGSGTSAAW